MTVLKSRNPAKRSKKNDKSKENELELIIPAEIDELLITPKGNKQINEQGAPKKDRSVAVKEKKYDLRDLDTVKKKILFESESDSEEEKKSSKRSSSVTGSGRKKETTKDFLELLD